MDMHEREFSVLGMSCANCARAVERALRAVPGVSRAQVDIARETVRVEGDPDRTQFGLLARAVERAGYRLLPPDALRAESARRLAVRREAIRLAAGAALAGPLALVAMARDFGLAPALAGPAWIWVMAVLATPVQFWVGAEHYRIAWRSLRLRAAGMDLLVALGSSAAYFSSLPALIWPERFHPMFEAGAVIIVLVRLGKFLEARARGAASAALRQMMEMMPRRALRLQPDGNTTEVEASELRPGDRVVIRPGERVAADGVILSGESALDESPLTGESEPAERGPGEAVFAGSVNGPGALTVEVRAAGEQARLGQIARRLAAAQGSRAPIQKLADRVAAVFVPVIAGVALATLAGWAAAGSPGEGLIRAVAVLVVACPCALGLATPVAMTVAMGRGAEMGVLFRRAESLEALAKVDLLLSDKTGTLTLGRPRLIEVVPLARAESEALRLAAALERHSSHPFAQALVAAAQERGLEIPSAEEARERAGFGIAGRVGGAPVELARGIAGGAGDGDRMESDRARALLASGASAVTLTVEGRPAAMFFLGDTPNPTARAALERLSRFGIELRILTGDRLAAARATAQELGVPFEAELFPEDKLDRVRAYQRAGRRVAMLGDGINDGPALAAADAGIALGAGTDLAKEAAEVTVAQRDLAAVVRAVALARATLRVVRQNLFWAFFYNLLLVPLAAGAFAPIPGLPQWLSHLHPALAALAMSLSSLTVVGNALRLRRFRSSGF